MARNVSISTPREYVRSYSGFTGVALGGTDSAAPHRLAYAENMYRDWNGDESCLVESVPGYRRVADFGSRIYRIYEQRSAGGESYLLIHAGTGLYRMKISERDCYTPAEPIATLPDSPVCFFPHGGCVYAVTGEDIIRIDSDGEVLALSDHPELAYAPIVALNGKPYEQPSLISTRFREEFVIEDASEYTYGTSGLKYKVIDPELRTCALSGIESDPDGIIHVPAVTLIGGKEYQVIRILDKALSSLPAADAIHIAQGVEEIGAEAFASSVRVKRIVIPSSVKTIGAKAFGGCVSLEELYIGEGVSEIGANAFDTCVALKTVHYAGSEEMLAEITGTDQLDEYDTVCDSHYGRVVLRLPLTTETISVSSVTEMGVATEFECIYEGDRVIAVVITSSHPEGGTDIIVEGSMRDYASEFGTGTRISGRAAIVGTSTAEVFDGRVFLAGNPALPNTVFFSSHFGGGGSPLYFGAQSYFNDGVGGHPVCSMLAVHDSLAVFKSGDDGSGSIFYHTPTETGDDYMPKIYPVSYVHSGISARGRAVSFFDDPVFITESGIYALTKKAINYERSVACRSHNVNYDLLKERPEDISLTEWCGYLVVGGRGRIYLADSRSTFMHASGGAEYEWFVLKDIGSYKNSTRVYRYDSYAVDNYVAHDTPGEICEEVVYSAVDSRGEIVYYASVDGKLCTLYPTEQLRGGDFSPAVCYLGVGELLFFGTEDGVLSVFNNDKRGIAPEHISSAPDFDPEEYRREHANSIHPYYYTFDSHAVRYAIKTVLDNCDIPHLTKSTVKNSLVVKLKSHTSSEIRCEVGTDRTGYREITRFPDAQLSFAELNFESLTLATGEHHTLPIGEREKRWVEKEIAIYSDSYASPIGIYSITYRYSPAGRIKRN